MIKNKITYKNKPILIVYHQGFPDEHLTLPRRRQERVGENLLIFSEEYVPDTEWDNLTGYAWEEKALITPKGKHNPYYENACANMTHRIYLNKPSVIWKKNGTTIDENDLKTILEFIKKYTGMNLEEHPIYLGDTFLFSASEFEYHSTEKNSIIISHLQANMRIVLRLKKGPSILQNKIIDITENTEELEIATDCDWDNHDIEIYENDKLIYLDKDISYMRCMHLNLTMAGRKKRIPLLALQEYYELESQNTTHESIVGSPPEPVQQSLDDMNQTLVRKIRNQKASDRFLFVRPGELNIAFKKITEMMHHATDELWIIDSYFTDDPTDMRKQNYMTDWLRILARTRATQKNIVFYCKNEDKAYSATMLKEHILKDSEIRNTMISNSTLAIQLIQTRSPIHDRFLIIRNGDTYSGLSIGTSFNSLDSNHYCIQILAHREAKEVLETLLTWMETNVVAEEVCKYDHK